MACNGGSSDPEAKGYCDFSQNDNGVCKFCGGVSDGCDSENTKGKMECKDICEGIRVIYANMLC